MRDTVLSLQTDIRYYNIENNNIIPDEEWFPNFIANYPGNSNDEYETGEESRWYGNWIDKETEITTLHN